MPRTLVRLAVGDDEAEPEFDFTLPAGTGTTAEKRGDLQDREGQEEEDTESNLTLTQVLVGMVKWCVHVLVLILCIITGGGCADPVICATPARVLPYRTMCTYRHGLLAPCITPPD